MKKTFYKIFAGAFIACVAFGCTDDVDFTDVNVTPVSSLGFPAEGHFLHLQSGTGRTFEFSWGSASAEDGMGVQYELLFFDQPSGGNQIGLIDARLSTSIVVTHKQLNKITGLSGVASGETGAIYWTVRASRGHHSALYEGDARKLNIRRMIGFDDIPANLYITGPASETGDDLSAARQFKMTSAVGDEGEFEIYTEIGSGTFNMVSSREANHRTFGILNNMLEETTEGATYDAGIYRITVDFTVKTIEFVKINSLNYVYMQNTGNNTEMVYAGGGIWQLEDFELKLDRPGWGTRGFEERYRFEANTGGGTEVWGPYDSGLDSAPGELNFNSDYFTVVARPYADFWNPKWKWHQSAVPDLNEAASASNPFKRLNVYVDMSNNGGRYYHHYTVL